jgi:gliding motility-associated protein GldC
MKSSEIKFIVSLDKDNVPEKITWEADESPTGKAEPASAINLSIWEPEQKGTLRIDLWTKEMATIEMKKFYIVTIGGMADSIKRATGDEFMYEKMNDLCVELAKHLAEESKLG